MAPHISISPLGGGESSASWPGRFPRGERAPGTHWLGSWVGLGAHLDAVAKKKKILFVPAENRSPVVQKVITYCKGSFVSKVSFLTKYFHSWKLLLLAWIESLILSHLEFQYTNVHSVSGTSVDTFAIMSFFLKNCPCLYIEANNTDTWNDLDGDIPIGNSSFLH